MYSISAANEVKITLEFSSLGIRVYIARQGMRFRLIWTMLRQAELSCFSIDGDGR
ncbi:MAG: hypothetical protein AAGF98_15700 [Cyanobacteria bacterium P01_H01_bin.153]